MKKLVQRFLAVHGAVRLVAFLLQGIFQTLEDERLVIHQQDLSAP